MLRKYTPKQKTRRKLFHGLMLLGAGCLFALLLAVTQPFYTFNLWFSDRLMESNSPTQNIVMVGIDDQSLEEFGKWSEWTRDLHARAVKNLSDAGASVIGYDVIFAGASPDDEVFAEAINEAGVVVLAAAGDERLDDSVNGIVLENFIEPEQIFINSSAAVGHVNIVPDPDGKVREVPLIASDENGNIYPSLSTAMLHVLFKMPLPEEYPIENGKINMLMRDIPVDEDYFMRINMAVMDNSLDYISYGDVINNNFDAGLVKNKIVLIGMMATADLDTWGVPNSSVRVPGVLIHAAAMDTILRMQFVNEAGLPLTLLIILLLSIICALLFPWSGVWHWTDALRSTGIITGLLAAYIAAAVILSNNGYILNILYPSLSLLVLYIVNLVYMVVRAQSDKRFVKDLFGRYVSPQVSREIVNMADEGSLKLGGEEREVTILFADIRNFTTISEQMTADGVVKMLNTCLPVMIEAITNNGGLVNKFAGDNIMGVWNAPQSQYDHAYLAVKAAWEAQQKMADLCSGQQEMANVHFGIGINTGKAVAGNIGSSGRAEYTVIGDAVNLASRICSAAPAMEILIGPDTYRQVETRIEGEPLPPQLFKGKSLAVVVYRVKELKR